MTTKQLGQLAANDRDAMVDGPFGSDLKASEYVDNGIPIIRLQNIRRGAFLEKEIRFITPAKAHELARHSYRPGDVVIAKLGECGAACIVPPSAGAGIIVADVVRFRGDPTWIEHRYLVHYLNSMLAQVRIAQLTNGTTRARVNLSDLKQIPVPVPDVTEQRRIADILDKADAIRRKRKEAIILTEELLRSVFLEMFGDPVTNPKGWPVKPLGDLADAASGVTKGKRYDGQSMVTVPYMRVANVQDGHLVLDEVKTITVSEGDARRYQLANGDVLLTEGGDPDKLGRGTVWRGEIAECIHQNHIFRVRPGPKVRAEYLSAIVGSDLGKRYFLRAAKQTTGIATINITQLKAFPMPVPPIEVQDTYVKFVLRAARGRATLHRREALIGKLFDSLVARAFSGDLCTTEVAC